MFVAALGVAMTRRAAGAGEPLQRWANVCVVLPETSINSISGLVVEYIVAIDVTRVRFPADACMSMDAPSLLASARAALFLVETHLCLGQQTNGHAGE